MDKFKANEVLLILVGFISIHVPKSFAYEICHNKNGSVILIGNGEKNIVAKSLNGRIRYNFDTTDSDSVILYVEKHSDLNFSCQNQNGKSHKKVKNIKKSTEIACPTICQLTVISLNSNIDSICTVNKTLNCKVEELKDIARSKLEISNPKTQREIIDYWVLDPGGNDTFQKCQEIDKKGENITVDNSIGENDTQSFRCQIQLCGYHRHVIIKVQHRIRRLGLIPLLQGGYKRMAPPQY